MYASMNGHEECLKLLIAAEADVEHQNDVRDHNGGGNRNGKWWWLVAGG